MIRLSLTLTDYSSPEGPAHARDALAATARAADAAGLDTLWVADHLIQAAPTSVPTARCSRRTATLGVPGRPLRAHPPRRDGQPRDLPRARAADQGVDHPRRAVRRPRVARPRRRLPRGRRRTAWACPCRPRASASSGSRRRCRSPAHVGGRRDAVPRPPLPPGAAARQPGTAPPAAPADPHRRHRRAAHPAARGTVRRRVQRVRHPGRRPDRAPQARRAAAGLRGRWPALRAVEKTISSRLAPGESTAAFVDRCRGLAELGIQHVVLLAQDRWTPAAIEPLAEAAAALAQVEPAR